MEQVKEMVVYQPDEVVSLEVRVENETVWLNLNQITMLFDRDKHRHNLQYEPIEIQIQTAIHDRFLIIDNTVYHIGASLKDLGKRLFAFSKMELEADELLKRIQ